MGSLAVLLWSFVAAAIVPALKLILRALGIGSVTYLGFSALIDAAKSQISSLLSGISSDILQILALSGFFECLSIIFSAYATRLILSGVSSGQKSFWRRTGVGSLGG
jgi:hypothetical protein